LVLLVLQRQVGFLVKKKRIRINNVYNKIDV